MARRSSLLTAIARDIARAQRKAEANHRRAIREQQLAVRHTARLQAAAEKDARLQYAESRAEETDDLNEQISNQREDLRVILEDTLSVDDTIDFATLRISDEFGRFSPPIELAEEIPPPDPPGGVSRLMPGAAKRHQEALEAHRIAESARREQLEKLHSEFGQARKAHLAKIEMRNAEVAELETAYRNGEQLAVETYNTMVLERSEYPEGFPQEFRLAYTPESRQLVIEYELPSPAVVPDVAEYRYVRARDAIESKTRKVTEIRDLYQDVVASVALRTIHEVFEADQAEHLATVVFNGLTVSVDPATGRDTRPCLISVRATKEAFQEIDLRRVDKRACLRNLGAQVSARAAEMQAVRPVVEFNMVDKRFIDQGDVLSGLESRPNLMELTPAEFETLVSNMFGEMGLDTKLTRSSRDGGVDAVAFDPRPILGGKVVIQAKRYRNTVGVSAVRDLYGTMMNEGASKGILVATSGYGPDAFEFAKDKPIELLDGGGLLYLLEQIGIQARIVFPVES